MFKVDHTNEKKLNNKENALENTPFNCLKFQEQRTVSWLATLFRIKVFVQYRLEWPLAGFNSCKVQCI